MFLAKFMFLSLFSFHSGFASDSCQPEITASLTSQENLSDLTGKIFWGPKNETFSHGSFF